MWSAVSIIETNSRCCSIRGFLWRRLRGEPKLPPRTAPKTERGGNWAVSSEGHCEPAACMHKAKHVYRNTSSPLACLFRRELTARKAAFLRVQPSDTVNVDRKNYGQASGEESRRDAIRASPLNRRSSDASVKHASMGRPLFFADKTGSEQRGGLLPSRREYRASHKEREWLERRRKRGYRGHLDAA